MALLSTIYFLPQINGKTIRQDDINAYKGAVHEKNVFEKQEGRTILWTNSMFGGMPTYQISSIGEGNYIKYIRLMNLGIKGPIGAFLSAMLCMYILLCTLKINPWLSLVGAIAFGFTTNNVILWDAGHVTKVASISYLPLVLAGLLLIYKERYLSGGALFVIGLSLNLLSNHVQMTYYFAICLVFLWIMMTVLAIKEGQVKKAIISSVILLLGSAVAIGTTATNYLVTYEYQEDTMRGKPILSKKKEKGGQMQSSSETNGLSWDYAMQWSAGTGDLFTTLIPGLMGSRSGETVNPKGELVKIGVPKGQAVPLYFGSLPFTSGPNYIGAIIFFFMILGIILYQEKWKWWLVFAILLTAFMAMGSNFSLINRTFFDHLPLFNKFRSPNSVLGVTAIFTTVLAILGAHAFFKSKDHESKFKALKIAGGITLGICLIVALFGIGVDVDSDSQLSQYGQQFLDALHSDRSAYVKSDAWRSFGFIAAAGVILWLSMQGKVKERVAMIVIVLLVLVDLWGVDKRYIDNKSFVSKSKQQTAFTERPVDTQILRDKALSYRVLDLSVSTFNNATTSYFHKTIGGYSAAKLQRYQDLIDNHISKNSFQVLNMLNTKYIITQERKLNTNNQACGNAWFVEDIIKVNSPDEEIDALNNIKADSQAIVLDSEFGNYIGNFNPEKTGSIQLTSYAPDRLTYQANTTKEQFAVFSEIWYGPDKGWNAYIDNKPVEHVRANYILRSLKVPAGKHKIEFKFEPKTYALGKSISIASSLIALLLLGIMILFQFFSQNKKGETTLDS